MPTQVGDITKLGQTQMRTRMASLKTATQDALQVATQKGIKGLDKVGQTATAMKGSLNLPPRAHLALAGMGGIPNQAPSKIAQGTANLKDVLQKFDVNLGGGGKRADGIIEKANGTVDDIPKNIEDMLTPAQKKSVKKINNNINDHLTDGDFSGTRRDLEGNPVPKKGDFGKYWDHLDEMLNTHKSLMGSRRSIENSLKNPNLPKDVRNFLQNELQKANDSLKKIDDLFNEFGGTDKWLKK
ncbi:polymorphic toxin type 28 domain-containing protein [Listeria sp. ILCC792]|uniref:polymorphic toxin type 28 domain-containing protein n=1 Tax=Listeria sp. ILCC792 TaxID=1918331 RepID=UPI001C6FCB70|nr:polymorphic toxin type 28 domain-containing protein [Listeria sp. ILCC792]